MVRSHKKLVLCLLILFGLCLSPTVLEAQSPALTANLEQGSKLKAAEKYKEAVPYYVKALEIGERELIDREIFKLQRNAALAEWQHLCAV